MQSIASYGDIVLKQEEPDRIIKCPFCGRSFCDDRAGEICRTDRMCMVCGYTWRSRGNSIPRRCPSCRSTEWNVSRRQEVSCVKCGHKWIPRGGSRPYMCPKCKSTDWRGVLSKPRKIYSEEDLQHAVALYSEGKGCVEAAAETGVPLEIIVLRIRDISGDPIRMGPARR